MTPSSLCVIASQEPPSRWPREILHPLRGLPVSIFGHQQVAMDRSRSVTLAEALVWTGCCESHGAAKRLVQGNAVMVNRVKAGDHRRVLAAADALPNLDAIVIEAGRHNFAIIELC